MANAGWSGPAKTVWLLSNPWPWFAGGGTLVLWSWLWTVSFVDPSDYRVIPLAIGLLLGGAGLWLRGADRHTTNLLPTFPSLALLVRRGMGVLFASAALGITILLGVTLFQSSWGAWKPGATFLIWLSFVPPCAQASWRCFQPESVIHGAILDALFEVALAVILAALFAFVGSLTLSAGGWSSPDWDTMRMFLRALAAVGVLAGALLLISIRMRRLVISLLLVLHFASITTACLSPPPSPWIVQQMWTRLFRPYLEFMYLNNAYHFYAPNPNPTSLIWFRLIYTDSSDRTFGWWYKLPELDEKGISHHTVALEYQRFVALTEAIAPLGAAPPPIFTNANGEMDTPAVYRNRLELSVPRDRKKEVVGDAPAGHHYRIPLDPLLPQMQQLMIPGNWSRRQLESYARFVSRRFATHPEQAGLSLQSVKIYRVIHDIPVMAWLNKGLSPTDPALYHPCYLGNYQPDGKLIEDGDPYRYWVLPVLRADPNDPNSKIRDFARLHAGDPNWVRPATRSQESEPPAWGPDEADKNLFLP